MELELFKITGVIKPKLFSKMKELLSISKTDTLYKYKISYNIKKMLEDLKNIRVFKLKKKVKE